MFVIVFVVETIIFFCNGSIVFFFQQGISPLKKKKKVSFLWKKIVLNSTFIVWAFTKTSSFVLCRKNSYTGLEWNERE